jgi:enoyl-CoA hydratase/carnithine racemase
MAFTEVGLGLVPGGGGSQRLPRLVGAARAAELLYLGTRLTGADAERMGLVNRSVPASLLATAVAEMAAAISAKPGTSLRFAKRLLRASQETPLSKGLALELDTLLELMDRQASGPVSAGSNGHRASAE